MVSSVVDLCKENHIDIKNTIYRNSPEQMTNFKLISGDFYEFKGDENEKALIYKNTVKMVDFSRLTEMLPALADLKYHNRDELPHFAANLDLLKHAFDEGRPIGVEGGPCLFGTDEVIVKIKFKNGDKHEFDFNTGKSYSEHGGLEDGTDMAEFIWAHVEEISAIHFNRKKFALTPQEWAFIKYPFEMARVLGGSLVMPIPDLSYAKYLRAIVEVLPESICESAMDEFHDVIHGIADLYLDVMQQMQRLYNSIPSAIVHERDTDICQKYYEARSPFMDRNRIMRKLTRYPERREPVKDYCSMPALPYYLFGTKNCLQVDSMDETDSYRKCIFAHKGTIELSGILYPELLSGDKVHTIFEASSEMKEYGNYVVE